MSTSLLLLGLATTPGAVTAAGIHSTLRASCTGDQCVGITDPRALVDRIRSIFSARAASSAAASFVSGAPLAAQAHVAAAAEPVYHEDVFAAAPTVAPAPWQHQFGDSAYLPEMQTAAMVARTFTPRMRPPATAPPARCPRCFGNHPNIADCRGRPVPGVTAGPGQAPMLPAHLDALHPSAPCSFHSNPHRAATHTNAECNRPTAYPTQKRPPSRSPSTDRRLSARTSAYCAEAFLADPAAQAASLPEDVQEEVRHYWDHVPAPEHQP
jgi:hypothetical protein